MEHLWKVYPDHIRVYPHIEAGGHKYSKIWLMGKSPALLYGVSLLYAIQEEEAQVIDALKNTFYRLIELDSYSDKLKNTQKKLRRYLLLASLHETDFTKSDMKRLNKYAKLRMKNTEAAIGHLEEIMR